MTISLEAVPDGAAFLFPEGEFTLEAIEEWGKAQERHLARVDNPAAVPFLYVDADPPVFEPVQSEDAAWYCAEIARDPARLAFRGRPPRSEE